MGDSASWHAWASKAIKAVDAKPKKSKNPRLKCSSCSARTTKTQGKKNGWTCFHCKSPLKCQQHMLNGGRL